MNKISPKITKDEYVLNYKNIINSIENQKCNKHLGNNANLGNKIIQFVEKYSICIKKDTDNSDKLRGILQFDASIENYDLYKRIYTAVKKHFPTSAFRNLECDKKCWDKIARQDDVEAVKLILENSKQIETDVNNALSKATEHCSNKIHEYIINNFLENVKLKELNSFLNLYTDFQKDYPWKKVLTHYIILTKAFKDSKSKYSPNDKVAFGKIIREVSKVKDIDYMKELISCISIFSHNFLKMIPINQEYDDLKLEYLIELYFGNPKDKSIWNILNEIHESRNNHLPVLKYINNTCKLNTENFKKILKEISFSDPQPEFFKELVKTHSKKVDKKTLLKILSEICTEFDRRGTPLPLKKYEIACYILKKYFTSEKISTYLKEILKEGKYILCEKIIGDTDIKINDQDINSLFTICTDDKNLFPVDQGSDLAVLAFLQYRRHAIINPKFDSFKLKRLIEYSASKLVKFILEKNLTTESKNLLQIY